MRPLFASCLVILASTSALAANPPVEVGNHPTLGRVVFNLVSANPVTVLQDGDSIDFRFTANDEIGTPVQIPRNVLNVVGGIGTARMTVVPGSRVTTTQWGRTFVVDVTDPPGIQQFRPSMMIRRNPGKAWNGPANRPLMNERPVEPAPADSAAVPVPSPAQIPSPGSAPTQAPAPVPEPAIADAAPTSPPSPPPTEVPPPPASSRSFTVTAAADTGVAAFRRDDLGVVVFDEPVSDAEAAEAPSSLAHDAEPLQHGTAITVALLDGEALAVTRSGVDLTVTVALPTGSSAEATVVPNGIFYQLAKPGRVLAMSDPKTGQTLLVGTTKQSDGDHARIEPGRSAPGYVLLPTWLGIAVATSSDRVDLQPSNDGYTFTVAEGTGTSAVVEAHQENQFALPVAPTEVLSRRLEGQIASVAAAPPRGRGPDRVAAARTMLALGLGPEAEALLTLAANDDPVVARDPAANALTGIAAILSGRPAEATGLDNPALPAGGDIALWRALRDVELGQPAPALAGSWPLLTAYPEAICRQITPQVMEAAAKNGADIPASAMAGPTLALARALKLAHDGKSDAAIDALTAVKNGIDDAASVRAAVALAEYKLQIGRTDALATADQLDRQTIRWRGDTQELALHMRVAELRSAGGKWRAALEGLQQTQALFPDEAGKIAQAKANVFQSLLAARAGTISPLELVLIAADFTDSLPKGEDGDRLAALLSEKLAALDLPERAIPILEKLVDGAQSPVSRAEYGLRLAQMKIDAGRAADAEELLNSLDPAGLDPAREHQRTMLVARAKAGRGDYDGAAVTLLTLATPDADELRAAFYAKAGDWQRSLETLETIVASSVPETGQLTEAQQDLLLRTATAAVQAGSAEALKKLALQERRLQTPRAELFRVLTATAVKSPDDLPRAARELAASKTLPGTLSTLTSR